MNSRLSPGVYVRHPDLPEWGLGQVQSAVGARVTVNFEHAGKRLINTDAVGLIEVDLDAPPAAGHEPSGPQPPKSGPSEPKPA